MIHRTPFTVRALCAVAATFVLAPLADGAERTARTFTHFESFESASESGASDPRDVNGNGVIDCGTDNNCDTVTSCAESPALCDEWTLPLPSDPDLRLSNEANPVDNPHLVYFKTGNSIFPSARGQAGVVGAGSTEICPILNDQGLVPSGVRADLMDWHIHTVKTPDIDGRDTSKSGTQAKAFRGQNSLHWGRHVSVDTGGSAGGGRPATVFGDTYCIQCVNAFVLDREGGMTLNQRARRSDPLRLSFWHIAEFCDDECFTDCRGGFITEDVTSEMGIVEVRHAPAGTSEFGVWERIVPDLNPYDGVFDTFYATPHYEPNDDVNPAAPAGSDPTATMCFPLSVYMSQGSVKGTDPACSDGDGDGWSDCGNVDSNTARGEAGVGVWARTSFNLGRYAGRRIQVRFVTSTSDSQGLFTSYLESAERLPPFHPPEPGTDDGWYIDDIRVSGLVK